MSDLVSFDKLSEEQLRAAKYEASPLAIIAGAGTGKTTVMSARVVHLVNSGQVQPEQILGLTFTNKAASQLRTRIAKQLGKEFQDQLPTISTYHSFARQLLIDHGAILGIEPDHKTLTDSARAQLALKVLSKTQLEITQLDYSTGRLIEMLLNLDDLLAEHLLDFNKLAQFDQEWIEQLQPIATNEDVRTAISVAGQRIELIELVNEFRTLKHQLGFIDFADQMRLSVELLSMDSELSAKLKQQYQCVLLDEYQDTSVAQQQMLLLAFGDGHSVTAVGDPLQSIYAWRGASADTTRSFPQLFRTRSDLPAQVLSLSENYRSAASVLTSANEVIASLRTANPGSKPLVQGNTELGMGAVRVGCYERVSDEIAAIVAEISTFIDNGVKVDEIAVLGRTAASLLKIHQSLISAGIPAALVGVETISRTPEVVEILSLVEAAADPLASAAVARLLISPRLNIGDRDLAELAKRAAELAADVNPDANLPTEFAVLDLLKQASLSDSLLDLGNSKISAAGKVRMRQLAEDIESVRTAGNALDSVWRAIQVLNMDIELYANPTSRITQRANVVAGFVDLVRGWTESSDDQSVAAFISWVNASRRFKIVPKIEVPLVSGAVSLLTIHRAKGLEWPHVFIPEVTATVFPTSQSRSVFTSVVDALPHSLRGDRNSLPSDPIADKKSIKGFKDAVKQYALDEELRLFYVALTRAQHSVTVTSSWWGDTQKGCRGPSPFYRELAKSATTVLSEFPEPDQDQPNPYLVEEDIYRTQANPQYREKLTKLANEVLANQGELTQVEELTEAEQNQLAAWDQAIGWLTTAPEETTVTLPNLLTATNLIKVINSPAEIAQNLMRPLPTAPARVAASGTAVHAKIEGYYKMATLIDLDELVADPPLPDEMVVTAFAAFEDSPYAKLRPIAVEWGFQLPIGAILISGRVDAVFEINGMPVLVDWKTGSQRNADPMQLAIYRLAWAIHKKLDITQVKARFVFLPDLTEIEANQEITTERVMDLVMESINRGGDH